MRLYLPELLLALFAAFFAFRELGTFPSAWLDDSLFMLVAKNLAEGRGYTLPVLTQQWHYSYVLGVGPTVIVPAALSIMLFGFSVAVARLPFAILVCVTSWLLYRYTHAIANRHTARIATGLLVSFSAFVNTGKPVLGEVPAFFFLVLALLTLRTATQKRQFVVVGFCLGCAVISKITFGIVFPAMGIVGLWLLLQKQWHSFGHWFIAGVVSVATFGAWRIFEMFTAPGAFLEIVQYGLAGGGSQILAVLREQPDLLLRFQYLYLTILICLSFVGLWHVRKNIGSGVALFIASFVVLFVVYFLNGPGWYRHILPAHLVLIPFVYIGAQKILPRVLATLLCLGFIVAQGVWQLDHRGSLRLKEAEIAAQVLLKDFADTPLVVQEPEIYIRLPYVSYRYFLSEEMKKRDFVIFDDVPLLQSEYCLPLVQKMHRLDQEALGERIRVLNNRYVLVSPPADCVSTLQ